MPKITQDMIDFVINWSKIATTHTIVAIPHEGKSRNAWIDVKDVANKSETEVKTMLQEKAAKAFEVK